MAERFDVHSGSAVLAGTVWGDDPKADGADGAVPFVFLHPGVGDRRCWTSTIECLPGGIRCVAYDRRGFGDTTYGAEEFSHLDDLWAVLEARAVAAAVLVGNSMGGGLAIDAALAAPERIRALVLIGTAVTGVDSPDDLPAPVQVVSDAIDAAEETGDLDEVNRLEARLWLDGPDVPEGRVGSPARDLFLAMNGLALVAPDVGTERPRPPAWGRLSELRLPVTVVVGDLDLPHVVERSHALAASIPGARLVVIPGTAHLPQLERPETVAALVAGVGRSG